LPVTEESGLFMIALCPAPPTQA